MYWSYLIGRTRAPSMQTLLSTCAQRLEALCPWHRKAHILWTLHSQSIPCLRYPDGPPRQEAKEEYTTHTTGSSWQASQTFPSYWTLSNFGWNTQSLAGQTLSFRTWRWPGNKSRPLICLDLIFVIDGCRTFFLVSKTTCLDVYWSDLMTVTMIHSRKKNVHQLSFETIPSTSTRLFMWTTLLTTWGANKTHSILAPIPMWWFSLQREKNICTGMHGLLAFITRSSVTHPSQSQSSCTFYGFDGMARSLLAGTSLVGRLADCHV